MSDTSPAGVLSRSWLAAAVVLVAACSDSHPTRVVDQVEVDPPAASLQALDCRVTVATGAVSCGAPGGGGASRVILGGQNDNVRLTSSNVSSVGGIFQMDVTVQNLLPEGLGTPDGVVVDTAGIKVFFFDGPTTTGGTGMVTVANADGEDLFMGSEKPFFRYAQKLAMDEVSGTKTWQFAYDPGVTAFGFKVYVQAEAQPLLVINEVMSNPVNKVGVATDQDREWFEVYNAGRLPVQMQGMLIADSAGSGRQRYHRIAAPLEVRSGAYVVLGMSTNTVDNGGVPVDYAYGSALSLTTVDAIKISRLHNIEGDTVTLDRTQYAMSSISSQTGITRELKNPALDNVNMDGSNWADALVTAVYGAGGRGTPKAQNSTYTP